MLPGLGQGLLGVWQPGLQSSEATAGCACSSPRPLLPAGALLGCKCWSHILGASNTLRLPCLQADCGSHIMSKLNLQRLLYPSCMILNDKGTVGREQRIVTNVSSSMRHELAQGCHQLTGAGVSLSWLFIPS